MLIFLFSLVDMLWEKKASVPSYLSGYASTEIKVCLFQHDEEVTKQFFECFILIQLGDKCRTRGTTAL